MWTSDAPASTVVRAAAGALLATALVAAPAGGQAMVRGQLALVQREGADAAELREGVVWLEPRDGAAGMPAGASSGETRPGGIVMRNREFLPRVLAVRVGDAVGFPNDDPFSHNVFTSAELGPFDLGLYRRGVTRSAAFRRAGAYPIHCNIHSRMVAFVVAVPTPWVTQPDADGRFAITGVPPGRYVLRAWHERARAPLTQEVTVAAGTGATVRLVLDARAYVAAPHLNKFGRPYALMRADRY